MFNNNKSALNSGNSFSHSIRTIELFRVGNDNDGLH